VSRGSSGPFADGGDTCFERSSVVAVGKIRRRRYAGARLIVRLLDGQEFIVFPSRQWPRDGAWLCHQASILRVRVDLDAPYAEEWRAVDPVI
jgi:N-dimethylarginine dimethylaminohydrolase